MSDNLKGALAGSLRIISENPPDSPLTEVTTDSVDELLERINGAFAEGMPEKLTDATLVRAVDLFRAQALKWEQDEEIRASKTRTRSTGPKKSISQAVDLDDF